MQPRRSLTYCSTLPSNVNGHGTSRTPKLAVESTTKNTLCAVSAGTAPGFCKFEYGYVWLDFLGEACGSDRHPCSENVRLCGSLYVCQKTWCRVTWDAQRIQLTIISEARPGDTICKEIYDCRTLSRSILDMSNAGKRYRKESLLHPKSVMHQKQFRPQQRILTSFLAHWAEANLHLKRFAVCNPTFKCRGHGPFHGQHAFKKGTRGALVVPRIWGKRPKLATFRL